jgi:uncharacterized protein Smg (DUF494 family)
MKKKYETNDLGTAEANESVVELQMAIGDNKLTLRNVKVAINILLYNMYHYCTHFL